MAENFDLIFGQNASQQYAWNDTDYQNGWETIGNIPPTAAQFDALQRRSDTKMKELNDELTPLVNADTADSRQPSTAYSVDDIKYSSLLPTGWFLTCTTAGTTSASEIVIPTPIADGDTVTDGTVVWEIHKIGAADLSTCANINLSNLSATGESKFANPDLSNLTAAGEARLSNIVKMPDWENEVAVTNVNNGFVYRPPVDGYIKINRNVANVGAGLSIYHGENENGTRIGTSLGTSADIMWSAQNYNDGVYVVLIPAIANEPYYVKSTNVSYIAISFVPFK